MLRLKNLLKIANVVLAIVFLWLFFSLVNFSDLAQALNHVNWLWLLAAALLYLLMNLTSVWRIRWLLTSKHADDSPRLPASSALSSDVPPARPRPPAKNASWQANQRPSAFTPANRPLTFKQAFDAHFASVLLSDVTPGRAGYAYLLVKLKRVGIDSSFAAKVLGVGLISDFMLRALLILACVYLISSEFLLSGVLIALGCVLAFFLLTKRVALFSRFLTSVPFYGKRLARVYDGLFEYAFRKRMLAGSFLVSAVGAVLRGAAWLCVFYSLGAAGSAGLPEFVALTGLLTAISFIPLSVAGIGLQEGAGAALFSIVLGVSLPTAAALMILIRVVEAGTDFVFGAKSLFSKMT